MRIRNNYYFIFGVLILFVANLFIVSCQNHTEFVLTPTITLTSGKGAVIGVLKIGMQPAKNVRLYLAKTIKDNTGQDTFAALDRINSPTSLTDEQGRFEFYNISPGKYGLVIDVIKDSYLLLKPDSNEALLIDVSSGNQIDLGTLIYDSLPIIPQQ